MVVCRRVWHRVMAYGGGMSKPGLSGSCELTTTLIGVECCFCGSEAPALDWSATFSSESVSDSVSSPVHTVSQFG